MDSFPRIAPGARMRACRLSARIGVAIASLSCAAAQVTSQPATSLPANTIIRPVDPPTLSDPPRIADAPRALTAPSGDAGWLRITASSVNVRAQPDLNSHVVARVERDALLEAVGKEFNWYAVKPPPDAFSLIAWKYTDESGREVTIVERQGDVGVIKVDEGTTLRVRAGVRGANADPQQAHVQVKLKNGDRVRILGEDGNWLRIAPPEGVRVYVSGEFAQRISDSEAAALRAGGAVPGVSSATPGTASPTVRPAGGWVEQLKSLEAKIESESRKPQLEQSWTALLTELKPVSEQRDDVLVAGSATRRMDEIQARIKNQDSLRSGSGLVKTDGTQLPSSIEKPAEKSPEAAGSQPAGAPAASPGATTTTTPPTVIIPIEPKPDPATPFDAEGELQATFAVPVGEFGLRYRLLDPTSRATRAYIEFPLSLNFKATENLGRYIGVHGEKTVDMTKDVSVWRVKNVTVLSPGSRSARNP